MLCCFLKVLKINNKYKISPFFIERYLHLIIDMCSPLTGLSTIFIQFTVYQHALKLSQLDVARVGIVSGLPIAQ